MSAGHRISRWWLVLSLVTLTSGSLLAQHSSGGTASIQGMQSYTSTPRRDSRTPDSFGLNRSVYSIPADNFIPVDSTTGWSFDAATTGRLRTSGGSDWFNAPINLPSGAHIYEVEFEVYDNDPVDDISTWIGVYDGFFAGNATVFTPIASTSSAPGWTYIFNNVDVTIDNFNNSYVLQVAMKANSGQHILRSGVVYYTLQVSPDPVTATFADVPVGHPQHQFVEALVAAGITAGCGGGNYCPNNPVTRGQMAVFLSKLVGLYWPN